MSQAAELPTHDAPGTGHEHGREHGHDDHGHGHGAPFQFSGPPVAPAKFGMWLFLSSEIMFFTGLIGAYIVLKISAPALTDDSGVALRDSHGAVVTAFSLEQRHLKKGVAFVNTLVLICSSLTMVMALVGVQERNTAKFRMYLWLTVACALFFLGVKVYEYWDKFAHGNAPWANNFFGIYFTLTGVHALHMVGGVVPFLIILLRSYMGIQPKEQTIELFGLYWHFVDIVWIFLFPLLYLS
jgi:heme/copper-type cytochrome/quinol oxidase subunit 3